MKNSTNFYLYKTTAIAFLMVATVFTNSYAQQIPHKISYQGKLLNNNVEVDGQTDFIFTIGGWSETHNNVDVTNGLYSVTLGDQIPIPSSTFNSPSVTLVINVEGNNLSPTTEILSVPFAYKAETAESAAPTGTAGGDLSGTYPNPVVSGLQNRTVLATAPNTDNVLKWNGAQWAPGLDDGLVLPYSAIYPGTTAIFGLINSNNSDCVDFGISNASNSGNSVYAWTVGDGAAIYGFTSGAGYAGYFSGDLCATGTIGACSDVRYKKNIKPLDNVLSSVLKLEGVSYLWRRDKFPEKNFNDKRQIGIIAQDIEKIYPELVRTDTEGYKTVDYTKLTPILLEAIKAQQQIIESQKIEMNDLKADVESIKIHIGMNAKAQK